jgi:hypothetical protein
MSGLGRKIWFADPGKARCLARDRSVWGGEILYISFALCKDASGEHAASLAIILV